MNYYHSTHQIYVVNILNLRFIKKNILKKIVNYIKPKQWNPSRTGKPTLEAKGTIHAKNRNRPFDIKHV